MTTVDLTALKRALRKASPAARRREWSDDELELLRRYYAEVPTVELARALGRKVERVCAKANRLGLKKATEVVSEIARQRTLQPGHGSSATRFKPGIVPANKGLRRPGWAPGRMGATQFKPGQKPPTTMPVGAFRVVEGMLERKFSEESGAPHKRWSFYGRQVWEAAHGPVPAGHLVVFKPGRHTTDPERVTLDALECITRAENLARNSIHTLHPKLAEVSRLRGSLKRAINRREKERS